MTNPTKIYIDATGVLATFGTCPTGIPRVEAFLLQSALQDPDERICLVKYNKLLQRYCTLNEYEEQQIRDWYTYTLTEFKGASRKEKLREALSMLRHNPMSSRELDRQIAENISGQKRRGLAYQSTKLLLRLYRLYRKLATQLRPGLIQKRSVPVNISSGVLLMSNSVFLGSSYSNAVDSCGPIALIVHDMIPVMQHEFAINDQHASTFSERINELIRRNFIPLCASRAASNMLLEYRQTRPGDGPSPRLFPMPSILHHSQTPDRDTDTVTLPFSLDEPYVLYCSTIEVRKNHLLLARIWRRALRERRPLPKLVCVGKWGWGVTPLSNFLKRHPELESHIVFTGPLPDKVLKNVYRNALFGVVPSWMEGWGFAASECLDFGVPVIVSDIPALRESSAQLMPIIAPNDDQAWYDLVQKLANCTQTRRELAAKIASHYEPVSPEKSWQAIKTALQTA